jgi:hypothetical protein
MKITYRKNVYGKAEINAVLKQLKYILPLNLNTKFAKYHIILKFIDK